MTDAYRYREWAAAQTHLEGDLPDPPFFDFCLKGGSVESLFSSLRWDDNLYSAIVQFVKLLPHNALHRLPTSPPQSINNKKKGAWGNPFPQAGECSNSEVVAQHQMRSRLLAQQIRGKQK